MHLVNLAQPLQALYPTLDFHLAPLLALIGATYCSNRGSSDLIFGAVMYFFTTCVNLSKNCARNLVL